MSRLRPLLAAVVLGLAGVLGAVWLLPGMLDWNRYRDGIATIASARLGRTVHLGGGVSLQLLPQPVLTASDVAIDDGGDGVGLTARALRLRVGLLGLLGGTVDARELTIQGADLRLPWPLPHGALTRRPPAWITGLRARVEDGRIAVGAAVLDKVEGTLATDAETGTLSVAGTGQASAGGGGPRTWQFTARLSRPGRDGSAALEVTLDGQGRLRDTGGSFSGQVAGDGVLTGRVAGRGPDLSLLMPAPPLPWRGDGRLSASGGLAVADDLALEIGGTPARGAVALRVNPEARLDLALAAGRLDLDAWVPALLNRPGTVQTGIPTGIDLSAEAAAWGGGTLRRLRAALDLRPDGVLLRDVSALLPGEASLELSGQAGGAEARFTGAVRLAAPDLRTTLGWVATLAPGLPTELPPAVLRSAAVTASVAVAPGTLAVSDLRGTLDGTAVSGSLSVAADRPRPNVAATLLIDRLSLDGLLPAGLAWTDLFPLLEPAIARLRAADIEIKLQVSDARWDAVPLGTTVLELQGDASRLVVRRLESRPFGARLTVSGQFADRLRLVDARLEFSAPELLPFGQLAGRTVPPALTRLLRGPGSAIVTANGPPEAVAARAQAEAGDLRFDFQPTLNLRVPRAAGPVAVHHPGAARLLRTLGLGETGAWLGEGSFSIVGQVVAAPGRIELAATTATAGSARMGGQVTLEPGRLTGQVTAEVLPLPAPDWRSAEPFSLPPGTVSLRVDARKILLDQRPALRAATGEVLLEKGVLRLQKLEAGLNGGALTGQLSLDTTAAPPRLAGSAAVAGMAFAIDLPGSPIERIGGRADLAAEFAAEGHGPAALLATLGGSGRFRLADAVLTGLDVEQAFAAARLPRERAMQAARAALTGGASADTLVDVGLSVARGVVAVDGTLLREGAEGSLTGSLDLRDAVGELRLGFGTGEGAPAMKLSGPVASMARTLELSAFARFLAEQPDPEPDPGTGTVGQARPPSSTE